LGKIEKKNEKTVCTSINTWVQNEARPYACSPSPQQRVLELLGVGVIIIIMIYTVTIIIIIIIVIINIIVINHCLGDMEQHHNKLLLLLLPQLLLV